MTFIKFDIHPLNPQNPRIHPQNDIHPFIALKETLSQFIIYAEISINQFPGTNSLPKRFQHFI